MNLPRSLNSGEAMSNSHTSQQNTNVLIAGLTCASFSLLATLVTLRWFLLMKRTYRHRLVMYLIFSDTFKAFWFFIFPVVVFSRGPIMSSSKFCQTGGFLLLVSIEASDFAILMMALHSILYIFRPPTRSGDEGGLYPFRKFIYPCWVVLPILLASLAFVNKDQAYTTAGTFCYLPRRPIWYRLALSWIPRYCIMSLILTMYGAVYVYVTLKFRGFSNLSTSDDHYLSSSESRNLSISDEGILPGEQSRVASNTKRAQIMKSITSRSASQGDVNTPKVAESGPWDEVSFITSTVQQSPETVVPDLTTKSRNARPARDTISPRVHDPTCDPNSPWKDAENVFSDQPRNSCMTGTTLGTPRASVKQDETSLQHAPRQSQATVRSKHDDPLQNTRKAIRKQLRYLFIYPAVYILMWVFPFASHCLLYSDYYVINPIYWLSIVTTCCFSLQAGIDCVVFSWREKPWRRIPEKRKGCIQGLRGSFSGRASGQPGRSAPTSFSIDPTEQVRAAQTSGVPLRNEPTSRAVGTHWWEAEGRKRKDSVWMGTDTETRSPISRAPTNNTVIEEEEEEPGGKP